MAEWDDITFHRLRPVELMYDKRIPDLFKKFLVKEADQQPPSECLQDKVLKAKAMKRNRRRQTGKADWEPQLGELVLAKCQPTANAAIGVISKFVRPYDGQWKISK
jgi:hypothetical protein